MTNSSQVDDIISYYQLKYEQKYDRRPVVNRNKLQSLVWNILKDLSELEVKKLLDFYFVTEKNPSLLYFCYEYDEVYEKHREQMSDLEKRKALLEKTEKNVMDFRRKYGNADQ